MSESDWADSAVSSWFARHYYLYPPECHACPCTPTWVVFVLDPDLGYLPLRGQVWSRDPIRPQDAPGMLAERDQDVADLIAEEHDALAYVLTNDGVRCYEVSERFTYVAEEVEG